MVETATRTRRSGWRRRAAVYLPAVAVLLAGLLYFHYFLRLPTEGEGPAGPAVPAQPFRHIWSERPVWLVGLGDSVTAGFGASPGRSYFERLRVNPPEEWPDLQGRCLSKVFTALHVNNLAVSGSTSLGLVEHQLPALETASSDAFGIVVITTGGNDLIHSYGRLAPREGAMYGATLDEARPWIGRFGQRLDAVVEAVVARFPGGCCIYIATIYDPSDGVGRPQAAGLPPWPDLLPILDAYNQEIVQCASRHPQVRVVDVHAAFLGHGIRCRQPWRAHHHADDPHYWYSGNLEDPNDRGYDAIRRLFLLAMADDLGRPGAFAAR